jgi:hypothetical protein
MYLAGIILGAERDPMPFPTLRSAQVFPCRSAFPVAETRSATLSRLARLGCNFVNVVFVLTQDWKSFVDKRLQIRIFHFGGSILKCTDRFIMIADHDFDVCRVTLFLKMSLAEVVSAFCVWARFSFS